MNGWWGLCCVWLFVGMDVGRGDGMKASPYTHTHTHAPFPHTSFPSKTRTRVLPHVGVEVEPALELRRQLRHIRLRQRAFDLFF